MLIKNLIFYPQITFFINIVVFCSFSRFGFQTSASGCRSGRGNSRGLPVSHRLYVPCAGVPGCRPYRIHIRYGFRYRAGSPLTFLPVYGHTQPASPRSRPLRLGVSHASHTHKTPAFRWRQSGFLRLRLHDMVLILPILLYTFLHGIFKLPAPMIDSMLFVPIGLENVCSKI